MEKGKRRNYLCTIHIRSLDCPYADIPSWDDCSFVKRVSFQQERGKIKNQLHWQVFIELDNVYRFTTLQNYFPTLCCSIKQQFGHPVAGRNYVHKEETRVGTGRYLFVRGSGYQNTCTHRDRQTHPCELVPHVLRIPSSKIPSRNDSEKKQLRILLENKRNEMKMWQAYLDRVPFCRVK